MTFVCLHDAEYVKFQNTSVKLQCRVKCQAIPLIENSDEYGIDKKFSN